MGRELLESEPVFRRYAEDIDRIFQALASWSILDEMRADASASRMNQTQVAQPANFLLQVCIARLLQSRGVQPAAIVGHSVGEVSAAYVSGMLSLEDAVAVSYHRSRLQQRAAGQGRVLATGLNVQQAEACLANHDGQVSIAAVNSAAAITLAGEPDALARIAEQLEQEGIFNRFLQVEVAYHSPHMDALKPELGKALRRIRPQRPALPPYSMVTARLANDSPMDGEYWCDNIREPVRFAGTIEAVLADGHLAFLEVGPHPALATSLRDAFRKTGTSGSPQGAVITPPTMVQNMLSSGVW
jgi:acyl transferase domain-containing protein